MKTKLMIAALLACLVPAAAIAAPAGHPGRHQHQNQQQQHQQHQKRGILYVFTRRAEGRAVGDDASRSPSRAATGRR